VTMAEPDAPHAELSDAMRGLVRAGTPVVRAVLRPRPLEPVADARVAFFCTAPPTEHERLARHLDELHGARVTDVSGNLADRARQRQDLDRIDAEVFVVELKAAAVDVVAEEAHRRGVRVVLAANDVIPIPGEPALDAELERLAAEAVAHQPQVVR